MLAIVLGVIVAGIIAVYLHFLSKTKSMMELAEKIPGPKTLPIIGNAMELGTKSECVFGNINRLMREHGTIIRVWLGSELVIFLSEPNLMEPIFTSNKLLDKGFMYSYIWPWLGDGLLTSTGEKWRAHRKLFTPTFHFKILEEFVEVFNNNDHILVEQLKKHVNGPHFDISPYINLCALDIICETAMGVSVNAQRDSESEYVEAVRIAGDIFMQRFSKPWYHPETLFNLSPIGKRFQKNLSVLHKMTDSVIKTRKQEYRKKSHTDSQKNGNEDIGLKRRLAFLDHLIQAQIDGANITDKQIREEVDTFMFEGHDTTTSGICFTLWALAKHQDLQEKAVKEMKQIFGDSNRDATFADLQEMKYLEQVIKECQRIYPSVPIFGRKLFQNFQLDGYTLPAGCTIIFNVFMLHRNPKYFPDPEKFDPDRFLPENCVGRHPYCYVPFSAGPRNCIGQKFAMLEMKTALSTMLRHYKLSLQDPSEEPTFMSDFVLKSPIGTKIKLQSRLP